MQSEQVNFSDEELKGAVGNFMCIGVAFPVTLS